MNEKILIFSNAAIIKNTFHRSNQPIDINKLDINKIVISDKDSFKYFIGYRSNDDIRPLCIKLPQISGYAKYFDSNKKYINFSVSDKKLLKAYNAIWGEVTTLMKKEFNSEPVYNNKYIKAKIKLHNGRISFHDNKIPNESVHYICLSVILLDSIVKKNKNYYPQILLEECKYAVKENKMQNVINEELKLDSSDDESNETN